MAYSKLPSGEQIQKVADSYARIIGYVWTKAVFMYTLFLARILFFRPRAKLIFQFFLHIQAENILELFRIITGDKSALRCIGVLIASGLAVLLSESINSAMVIKFSAFGLFVN